MGYAKIVQYADRTEYLEYERKIQPDRRRYISRAEKKRRKQKKVWVQKSKYAIRRAKSNFIKLVVNALYEKGRPFLITLTMHEIDVSLAQGYAYLAKFKYYVKSKMGKTLSYIAVPEWQKKGRLHYHLLCWGLREIDAITERDTRNLQRCYAKGFLDVRYAYDNSEKLAGYLAKYFTKGLGDSRTQGRRAYNATRDITRPRIQGSNTLSAYASDILPDNLYIKEVVSYDTQYLGRCVLTKYKTNK